MRARSRPLSPIIPPVFAGKSLLLLCLLLFLPEAAGAGRLGYGEIFTRIPESAGLALRRSFSAAALPAWGAIAGSTGVLYYYDEPIYSAAQRAGRKWGIGSDDHTRTLVQVGRFPIFRGPTDAGSAMYFLGDGWMHVGIAAGFLLAGELAGSDRGVNTGIMILHGILVETFFSQALKHAFGRESPMVKTKPRGRWQPFPSFKHYMQRVSSYDAMPSGHIMTYTHTFLVLAEQYPEYGWLIFPVGGLGMAALSFQMMNNSVHWASDYPLGIAMGLLFGGISAGLERREEAGREARSWSIHPGVQGGVLTLNVSGKF